MIVVVSTYVLGCVCVRVCMYVCARVCVGCHVFCCSCLHHLRPADILAMSPRRANAPAPQAAQAGRPAPRPAQAAQGPQGAGVTPQTPHSFRRWGNTACRQFTVLDLRILCCCGCCECCVFVFLSFDVLIVVSFENVLPKRTSAIAESVVAQPQAG